MRVSGSLLLALILLAGQVQARDYTNLPALAQTGLTGVRLSGVALCGERLIAVGERGAAIWSDNNGESWQQGEVPVSQLLTSVTCVDGGQAWAVGHGGVILSSDDRGESWNLRFDGDRANQKWLEYVTQHEKDLAVRIENLGDAVDPDLEFALEDASFAIEDAQEAINTGPADPFLDIWFRDSNYGIAVGAYGMIYRTQDAGESWELLAGGIENSERYHYYSLAVARDGTLFLSGEAGLMYRSEDGGATWERLDIGYDGSLFGVIVTDNQAVVGFGLRGNILRSEDRGETWQNVVPENNPGVSLYGGDRLTGGELVLVGAAGVVLQSNDQGLGFTPRQLGSRSTLSGAVRDAGDRLLVVGMAGLEPVPEENP